LLEDAGLEHDYVRLRRDEKWAEMKAQLVQEGAYSCTLPYIEVNGQKFFKTIPIMRYISVKLDNKYHGSTPEENQLLDVIAEVTDLWFDSLKTSFFGSDVSKLGVYVCYNLCVVIWISYVGAKEAPC
jgi:glutaredoxin